MADRTLYLVFSNPTPGKEDEFNQWYDEVHVRDVLATPGMLSAQRYKLADAAISGEGGMPPPPQRYLLVYEMEGDIDVIMGKVSEAAMSGTMVMSDALDMTSIAMSFWKPTGSKITA